jgi:transcriptional activator of cad operon
MERPLTSPLLVGEWRVHPASGEISRNGETARLEARTMKLLLCLAERAGEVVSIDDLLNQAWSGVIVSPDSVYQAVASLRRQLGDDPRQPSYIATVPRLGYRMVAEVRPWTEPDQDRTGPVASHHGDQSAAYAVASPAKGTQPASAENPPRIRQPRRGVMWAAVLTACLAAVAFLVFLSGSARARRAAQAAAAAQAQRSIAVLPLLDLTEGMTNGEFADGITEELIDKLSKVPGLRVPTATSSFYFKDKQMPLADIARSLGVTYVLDGSLRRSNGWVRVDTRLVRAENGYVIWSQTYDQPMDNILKIQDDIAGKVTHALESSIGAETAPR